MKANLVVFGIVLMALGYILAFSFGRMIIGYIFGAVGLVFFILGLRVISR